MHNSIFLQSVVHSVVCFRLFLLLRFLSFGTTFKNIVQSCCTNNKGNTTTASIHSFHFKLMHKFEFIMSSNSNRDYVIYVGSNV